MPELPDLTVYLESLAARIANKTPKRITLAHFEFEGGTLALTEAGTKRRASLHLVQGKGALEAIDPGGLELPGSDLQSFASRLAAEDHTLKRALTDPRLFAAALEVLAEWTQRYCARCQTGGRILADRALSRLLKKSWPRSIDELG